MNRNDNDKISSRQYTILIAAGLMGAGVASMPRNVIEIAGPDAWITTIAGGLFAFIAAWLNIKLALLFPQETFVTFSQKIVGKMLGVILSICFIVYFFSFAVYEVRVLGEASKLFILEETPIEFIMIIYLWVTMVGIRGGIESIARSCQLLFPIIFFVIILTGSMLFIKSDFNHLLPVLHTTWQKLAEGTFSTTLSYLGFEMILFIVPFLIKPQDSIKNNAYGIGIITFLYTFIMILNIGIFGTNAIKNITWPTITAVKTLDLPGTILERLESIFFAMYALAIYTTSIVFTFIAAYILSLLTGFREMKHLTYFILPLLYGAALIPSNIVGTFMLGDLIGKFGFILITFVPLLLLIVAKIRKTPSGS